MKGDMACLYPFSLCGMGICHQVKPLFLTGLVPQALFAAQPSFPPIHFSLMFFIGTRPVWLTYIIRTSIRNAGSAATAVRGTTLIGETYFHIQWAWLAFLIAQVALSALFLVGIMIQTAVWKVPVIKGSGSAAATLLALSAEDRARLEGLSTAATHRGIHVDGDFYRRLQRVSCRFRPREPGWGLEVVGHEQLRDSGDNGNRGGG